MGTKKNERNFIQDYWKAVGLAIEAEDRKIRLFVKHAPSLGTARESILRELMEHQTPAPFQVTTGFVIVPTHNIQDPPRCSRQCDLLVFDPTVARPVYSIAGFSVLICTACRLVIEVKSTLNEKSLSHVLSVSSDLSTFSVPTSGFAYTSLSVTALVDKVANFVEGLPANKSRLSSLPEFLCVHKKNILALRAQGSDKHPPEYFMIMDLAAMGKNPVGLATSHFMTLCAETVTNEYRTANPIGDRRRIEWFNSFSLPPKAKYWIDCNGRSGTGNVSS